MNTPGTMEPKDIPKGFRASIGPQARTIFSLEKDMVDIFQSWGYQPILTPSLEYEDVIARALDENTLPSTYRIIDSITGRVLLLRPDFTPSIARAYSTATTKLGDCVRLCYSGSVFRSINKHEGNQAQVVQAGGEFLGCSSLEADFEAIALCVHAIGQVSSHGLNLVLTHSRFIGGILAALEVEPAMEKAIVSALHKKDLSALKELLEQSGTTYHNREVLLKLPGLIGDTSLIDRARSLVCNETSHRALDELGALLQKLEHIGCRITLDLSELSYLNYYTGCSFELYDEECGMKVAGGGRYDNLVGKYTHPTPAVGFAVNINHLCEAGLRNQHEILVDYVVYSESDTLEQAQQEVERLRRQGHSAFWITASSAAQHQQRARNIIKLP
ncbi:Histidine--tRNA ligase [Desulfurispirillum indicum S5]|uniref:ATP phosphoribosyltransferase regulatory subunit n=1 Tax=Desulfurispirillum indicum (strain ATCC BAA-1389 / DSM 22839 / S5) TaxID=653733 RepID=E6W5Z4_DESIS|nr:ATP phosphoribosyltransferase regulatory subunit [Desulfurispirillum indicum]ADU64933.1 Histidine--tRNA ligase [Desulfurispirillum indicum S5]